MKKYGKLLINISLLVFFLCTLAYAQSASDITSSCIVSSDTLNISRICDNNIATHSGGTNVKISIASETPIGGIYIKYNKIPSSGLLNSKTTIAKNGFIHEFIQLNGCTEATLEYSETDICDLQILSEGIPDKSIQIWNKVSNNIDLLLCATHSDDDQLFFAGLLPYYASREDVNVLVAYFINHFDTYNRTHELLDGLWHCGITNYPVISKFPDGYSESINGAKDYLQSQGFTYDDILIFQKELLNKYRPQVAVLHDFKGEYGHGAHMLNTASFVEAYENCDDSQFIPKKVYVHLYDENSITMDFDQPLECFDGKSPFNVSQEAFEFHKSQHWTWFYGWIYGKNRQITKATQISSYNPCKYGLYYTSVGKDVNKNDLLENIETYSAQTRRTVSCALQAEADSKNSEVFDKLKPMKITNPDKTSDGSIVTEKPSTISSDNSKFPLSIVTAAVIFTITVILLLFRIIRNKRN